MRVLPLFLICYAPVSITKEVVKDWHGFWRIEYPFPRFIPGGDCFVLCSTVLGNSAGKFPLHLEISTEEARGSFKKVLWVEVASNASN